jgi:hypothetical protein
MNVENLPDIPDQLVFDVDLEDLDEIELIQKRANGPFVEVSLIDL